jgi:rare lipoprotein A
MPHNAENRIAMKSFIALAVLLSAFPAFAVEEGYASWYGGQFDGRTTSNGEIFDSGKNTAAHRTLPFGAIVKVENLDNGRSTVVRINDRGPFVEGRIIDLSRAAAEDLGMIARGVSRVRLEVLDFTKDMDRYAIQVGAFGFLWNAESARKRLEEAGFLVFYEQTALGITRVIVRGLRQKDIAEAKIKLKALGFENLMVRVEKAEREGA